MNDRNNLVNQIQDLLGGEGSAELANAVFNELRSDDRIYWDDQRGLVLRDDVDVVDVAARLS